MELDVGKWVDLMTLCLYRSCIMSILSWFEGKDADKMRKTGWKYSSYPKRSIAYNILYITSVLNIFCLNEMFIGWITWISRLFWVNEFSPDCHILFKIYFNVSPYLFLQLLSSLFPSGYQTQILHAISTSPPRLPYQSHSQVTINGQSASLSWCQVPIWDPQPIFSFL
jgi:hypothetical protein